MASSSDSSTSPGKGSSQTVTEQKVAKPEQSSLAYIIALITIGAAFGNMFMAGKIRNVMKMEMPKASSAGARAGHTYTGPGAGNGSTAGANSEYTQAGTGNGHQRWSSQHHQQASQQATQHILYLDPKVSQHLVTLGFVPEVNKLVHTYAEKDLKKRYRELVLQYHPDRIVVENEQDEAKRESFTKKFQLITQSYQYLMKDLDMRNQHKQSTTASTSSASNDTSSK